VKLKFLITLLIISEADAVPALINIPVQARVLLLGHAAPAVPLVAPLATYIVAVNTIARYQHSPGLMATCAVADAVALI